MSDDAVDPRLAALRSAPADAPSPPPEVPFAFPPRIQPAPEAAPGRDLRTSWMDAETEPQAALDLVVDLAQLALEGEPPASPRQADAMLLEPQRANAAVEIGRPSPAVAAPLVATNGVPARPEPVASSAATQPRPPPGSPQADVRVAPTVAPRPEPTLAESQTLFQAPILMSFPPRRADLLVEELGYRITGAVDLEVPWSEVADIREHRGRIRVTGPHIRLSFSVDIDGVAEPTLAAPFARVLAKAKAGALDLGGTAYHDLGNLTDSLRDRFHESDDPMVTGVLGGVMALFTAMFALVLPDVLMFATQASLGPTPGFLISTRLSSLDPRIIVAALGAAALLASIAGRVALGAQAGAWARGALRGWHRQTVPAMAVLSRSLAAVVWFPVLAAALLLLGVASAVPSARAQIIVDPSGVLMLREFPFLDSHHAWSSVTQILEIPAPMGPDRHVEGIAVVIHFASGSPLNTYELKIRNGSDGQLYALSQKWRQLADPYPTR